MSPLPRFSISASPLPPPLSGSRTQMSDRRSTATSRVGASLAAAHQLGLHGILAPAATGFGETLAMFEEHLTPQELPRLVSEETWETLPADPRQLRAVQDEDAS